MLFSGALRYALSVLSLVSGCFAGLALMDLRVCCFWVGLRVCGLVWWYLVYGSFAYCWLSVCCMILFGWGLNSVDWFLFILILFLLFILVFCVVV